MAITEPVTYEAARRQIDATFARKREVLESEYQAAVKKLDEAWALLESALADASSSDAGMGPHGAGDTRSATNENLTDIVYDLVDELSGPFTLHDVIESLYKREPALRQNRPINPTTVSGILRRLADDGSIQLVEQGRGSKPSTYQRTVPFDVDGESDAYCGVTTGSSECPSRENGESRQSTPSRVKFSLIEWVKDAIRDLDRFTQPELRALLSEQNPEAGARTEAASMSRTLAALRDQGVIELVEKGVGSVPSVYKNAIPTKPDGDSGLFNRFEQDFSEREL
jgi:hypothetical protein